MADYNPIASVNGASIKCPSSYQWEIEDISDSDAGRTEALTMDKKKVGDIVKLELEWQNITTAECHAILQAFKNEYFTVKYLDPLEGGYTTKEMYCGNRTAPMYNSFLGLWQNVSFNIIERSGL